MTRFAVRAALGSLTVVALALTVARAPADGGQFPARPIAPLVRLVGGDSQVAAPEWLCIRNAKDWEAAWERHAGKVERIHLEGRIKNMPVVDFDQCMILAVFMGKSTNSHGVRLNSISESADAITIRYDSESFQTLGPNGGGVSSQPYGLFIVPRSNMTVVFERDTNNLKGGESKWKEVARVGPPEGC